MSAEGGLWKQTFDSLNSFRLTCLGKSGYFVGCSVCVLLCPIKAVRFWGIPSRSHNRFTHLVGCDGEEITRKYWRTRVVVDWHILFGEFVKSPSLKFLRASWTNDCQGWIGYNAASPAFSHGCGSINALTHHIGIRSSCCCVKACLLLIENKLQPG